MKRARNLAASTIIALSPAALAQEKLSLEAEISASISSEYHGMMVPAAFSKHPVLQQEIGFTLKHPKIPGKIACFAWNNYERSTGRFMTGLTETDGGCSYITPAIGTRVGTFVVSVGGLAWGYPDPDSKVGQDVDVLTDTTLSYAPKGVPVHFALKNRALVRGRFKGGNAYRLSAESPKVVKSDWLNRHGIELTPGVSANYADEFFVFRGWLGATAEGKAAWRIGKRVEVGAQAGYTRSLNPRIHSGPYYGGSVKYLPRKLMER